MMFRYKHLPRISIAICSRNFPLSFKFFHGFRGFKFLKNLHKHRNNRPSDYNTPFHNGILFLLVPRFISFFLSDYTRFTETKTVRLCWLTKPTIFFLRIETFCSCKPQWPLLRQLQFCRRTNQKTWSTLDLLEKQQLTYVLSKRRTIQALVIYYLFLNTLFTRYRRHHINVPDVKIFDRIHSTQALRISLGQSEQFLFSAQRGPSGWIIPLQKQFIRRNKYKEDHRSSRSNLCSCKKKA